MTAGSRPFRYKVGDPDGFWSRVDKSDGPDACWPWTGCTNGGYGRVCWKIEGKLCNAGAHNIALWLSTGKRPAFRDRTVTRHLCNNGICCNPQHLKLGTQKENAADMVAAGRANTCTDTFRGEKQHRARLTEDGVREIRRRWFSGEASQAQMSRELGYSQGSLNCLIHGKKWRHIK